LSPRPVHVFTASILGGLHRLGILNQGTVNLLMKTVAPRLITYMISKGLLPSREEKPGPGRLAETLLRDLEAGSFHVEMEGDTLRILIEECNYCPKRVGGASLRGTACPIPRLIVELLHYYGYRVEGPPKLTVKTHGCVTTIKLR